MKLNLQIELDWIDEESNLDETVRQNVIDAVVGKIQETVQKQTLSQIEQVINETTVAKINQLTEGIFNDFLNREVILTDNYGSKLKSYPNVTEVVKERFDKFLLERVNDNGNPSDYGTKYTRIEYIIDRQIKAFADKFTTDAVKKVSAEVQQHVKDGLTTKLGSELMKVLKVNEMLQLPKEAAR